jgi:hypothetical protein
MRRVGLRLQTRGTAIFDEDRLIQRRHQHGERKLGRKLQIMDWRQKLQSARDAGQNGLDHTANVIIEEHLPKIQQLFEEKVGPAALAAAQNNQTMSSLFKMVYTLLPFPVRMIINEGAFVSFYLSNRSRLLPQSGAPVSAH